MSSELKLRRGTAAAHTTFTGAQGEITVKTDTNEIVVHDGVTPGGWTGGGYMPAGTGAVARTVQDKLREFVSVKDFGAVGDGVADDTAAVQAAATYAASVKKSLYVPAGTYRLTEMVTVSSGMYGDGKGETIFQAVNNGLKNAEIIRIAGAGVYSDFTVDGAVSADPGSWNSENYDSFTGWLPVYIRSNDVTLRNVRAQNALRAGISGWKVSNILLENCETIRGRGDSGDGFYFNYGAKNITFINCRAYDYTRIGFVFTGDPNFPSRGASFINCIAEYGHDHSVLYGGINYSAGFWAESCTQVSFDNCYAKNSGDRGFRVWAGAGSTIFKTPATFSFDACVAENASPPSSSSTITFGFNISDGMPDYRCSAVLNSCSTKSVIRGFYISMYADATLNNCSYANDGGDDRHTSPISAETGARLWVNGFFEYWTNRPAGVTSDSTNSCSIGNFSGSGSAAEMIFVRGYKTHDGYPCTIKNKISGATSRLRLVIQDTNFMPVGNVYFRGGFSADNCTITTTVPNTIWVETDVSVKNSYIPLSGNNLFFSWFDALYQCSFTNCTFEKTGSAHLYFYRVDGNTDKRPRFMFTDCKFRWNLETDNYIIRQHAVGAVSNSAGQDHFYSGCVFVNTGGATANNIIQWEATGLAAGRVYMVGCWKSSTISNVVKAGGWLATNSVINNLA